MNLYDKILVLCNERGVSVASVEKACGMSHGVIRRWNKQAPSADRLQRVAEYFGVTISYLLGDANNRKGEYYVDPEVSLMVQQLKDRPELKILFDASKDMSQEDLLLVLSLIKKMKG